ncbi:hypothetical protein [Dietzia sp. ANT_WB102]|uniref:hypothetical protein n=1 Tax=Dietzia sp. ANT_WB102 TaxID=2597345 RepID=UPI0011F09667|nr:hypothetical protein [Dietzia sp. ANT_WB102]KAA0918292.1 hypothetical protein FQ137_02715 [Dietzia sp. ANT_WB102]
MLAAASAITAFIVGVLAPLGAVAAPVLGVIGTAGPIATAGTALTGLAATGSAAGGSAALGGGAAAVASNPHATQGVQNGIIDTINQAKDAAAGSINDLNLPGVPSIVIN